MQIKLYRKMIMSNKNATLSTFKYTNNHFSLILPINIELKTKLCQFTKM